MTPEQLEAIRADTERALLLWLADNPVLADDGQPIVWMDGRPVALDVAMALHYLNVDIWSTTDVLGDR